MMLPARTHPLELERQFESGSKLLFAHQVVQLLALLDFQLVFFMLCRSFLCRAMQASK